MNDQTRNVARSLIATAAALMALVVLSHELSAEDLTSASYRLRGGTLSGVGEVALQSTDPGSMIGSVGVTIGQPALSGLIP